MTEKEFMKAARGGKTVFCLQYAEGKPGLSMTAVAGAADEVLARLSQKVAFCFLQMKRSARTGVFPAGQALDSFCGSVKEIYATMEAAWLRGEVEA